MTDPSLPDLLSRLALGGLSPGQRATLTAAVVRALQERGPIVWNGVRYFAEGEGIGRGLPWGM